jgi:flagellar biogenesis protein FliO
MKQKDSFDHVSEEELIERKMRQTFWALLAILAILGGLIWLLFGMKGG